MPTYDYVCRACEHRFEHFQSMQEPTLRKCPECGRLKLERLIGAGAGILFKGSGFYETDYKRKSPPADHSPATAWAFMRARWTNTACAASAFAGSPPPAASADACSARP